MTMDVRLRPVREDDLPSLFAHQLDPEAAAMAGFPSRDEASFLAHRARIDADPNALSVAVDVDGVLVGSIGSWVEDERRFVGYWFDRESWGRGVATAALTAFVEQVRDRPLYAFVAAHNVASMRVLEKCGFAIVSRDEEESLYALA